MSSTRIGFSTPKRYNPLSALIRRVTDSETSHTWFLYYDEDFKMDVVMESHLTGFRLIPFSAFEKHHRVVSITCPEVDLDGALAKMAMWVGSNYDFMGLLGVGFTRLGRFLKHKWKNPFSGSKYMFCSEACVRVLQWAGFPKADELNPDSTSPQDLLDFLRLATVVKSAVTRVP